MTSRDSIILGAGFLFLLCFSWWFSIREGRFHGIPRFFGFSGLFLLTWFNYRFWFLDAFSFRQIVSWLMLFLSLYYVASALYFYIKYAKPEGMPENTTRLISEGIYRYLRHPMYGSLIFLAPGVFLKHPDLRSSILATLCIVAFYITALVEEGEMIGKFGSDYERYRKNTGMFLPKIFPLFKNCKQ